MFHMYDKTPHRSKSGRACEPPSLGHSPSSQRDESSRKEYSLPVHLKQQLLPSSAEQCGPSYGWTSIHLTVGVPVRTPCGARRGYRLLYFVSSRRRGMVYRIRGAGGHVPLHDHPGCRKMWAHPGVPRGDSDSRGTAHLRTPQTDHRPVSSVRATVSHAAQATNMNKG